MKKIMLILILLLSVCTVSATIFNEDVRVNGDLSISSDPKLELTINGGLISIGEINQGKDLTISGNGVKMFFYPKKAAFRAGRSGEYSWNEENIGLYSVATGYATKATGAYSTSMGMGNDASGIYSFSAGTHATSSGMASISLGYFPQATGEKGSTALGHTTQASGDYGATALGYHTFATGNYGATALGKSTKATGNNGAIALGYNTEARGDTSIAMGEKIIVTGKNSFGFSGSTKDVVTIPQNNLFAIKNANLEVDGDVKIHGNLIVDKNKGEVMIFDSSLKVQVGELVALGDNGLEKTHKAYQSNVLGVVMDNEPNSIKIAFSQIREIWVNHQNGQIQIGDLLVPSDSPGVAMKCKENCQGSIIGKVIILPDKLKDERREYKLKALIFLG